ncbi:MAG: transposase [Candidatus Endonucleobacter bathymodioli]|uniref:Transposase n=1 Tax=Candidatus Endonucleibacter bathymodioli TaxID=539814 RepID=A0AA90NV73_9GAMM|nr:transposase [Candidatus Endonucleobacter bathymodioli]
MKQQSFAPLSYAAKKRKTRKELFRGIIKRAYRNKPLTENYKCFNHLHSGVRCTVERVFGVLKLHYGMAKARYLGLSQNLTRFEIMFVAHNIRRSLSIQQAGCA